MAILVEHDQLPVRVEQLRAREGAILPRDSPGLHVDGGDERRAEIAARAVRIVAEADDRADVHAHAVRKPFLGSDGLARRLMQLDRPAARAIG